MPKGVKINSDITGEGREARRGDVVVANIRMFLSKGEEVTAEYPESPRTVIDLSQRETIAGIRYGIEGSFGDSLRSASDQRREDYD